MSTITKEPAAKKTNALVAAVHKAVADLGELPPYEAAPDLYQDWGEEGDFKVWKGRGECA